MYLPGRIINPYAHSGWITNPAEQVFLFSCQKQRFLQNMFQGNDENFFLSLLCYD